MQRFDYGTAPLSIKLALSAFLLFAVVGLGVAAMQIEVRTGFTVAGALTHYRGDEATLQYPKSFGEMVEITHAHAFTMPLLALVLALALASSRAAEVLKGTVVVALFVGVGLELGLPWAVRYGPPWTVYLFGAAGALFGSSALVSIGVPLYDMWVRSQRDSPPGR